MSAAETQAGPDIDTGQIRAFVDALFGYASPGSFVSLRSFSENAGAAEKAWSIEAVEIGDSLDNVVSAATTAAHHAAVAIRPVVFAPPVAAFTNKRHARQQDIAEAFALSVEIDANPEVARRILEGLLGPATVVVASGGEWTDPATGELQPKLHCHWRLNKPAAGEAALPLLKEARRLATQLVGADPSNVPAVHPIRWPGSVHRKSKAKLCRIVSLDPVREIDLEAALKILRNAAVSAAAFNPQARNVPNGKTPRDVWDGTAELMLKVASGASYHPALVPLAARLVGQGMFPGAVTNLLRDLMQAVPPEQHDERWHARFDEIPRIVNSAEQYEPARETEPWPPPLNILGSPLMTGWPELASDCLPPVLYDYVTAEAERLNTDPCPLAAHVLTACSASISDAWSIKPKIRDHWTQQARLWTCAVKDVGARGIDFTRAAFWPIRKRDLEHMKEWKARLAVWKARQTARKRDKDTDDPEDLEPVCTRLYTNDATVEALSEILKDGGDHSKVLLVCDELMTFFGSFARYSEQGGGSNRALMLESYDGGPHRVDRIKRGAVFVPNFSVAIGGNIQTRKLQRLGKSLVEDGLFQRFMTVHAKPSEPDLDERGRMLHEHLGGHYRDLHGALSELRPGMGKDGPTPAYVVPDAVAERQRFTRLREALRLDPTLPTIIRETAPKWSGLLARITLIFHLVGLADRRLVGAELSGRDLHGIEGETVAQAARFLETIALPNLYRLGFETIPDEGTSGSDARWLAGFILAHGMPTITARDIGRANRGVRGKPSEIAEIASVLEHVGWLRRGEGRRGGARWLVNPAVHVRFAAAAVAERERRERTQALIRKAKEDGSS